VSGVMMMIPGPYPLRVRGSNIDRPGLSSVRDGFGSGGGGLLISLYMFGSRVVFACPEAGEQAKSHYLCHRI